MSVTMTIYELTHNTDTIITAAWLDGFYEYVDALLRGDCSDCVDNYLSKVKVEIVNEDVLIAWLTATCCAKSKLKNRVEFYRKAEERFINKCGPTEAKSILVGLE